MANYNADTLELAAKTIVGLNALAESTGSMFHGSFQGTDEDGEELPFITVAWDTSAQQHVVTKVAE